MIKDKELKKLNEIKIRKSSFFDGDPLPETYGDNKIVIIPKNPRNICVYWEINSEKIEKAKKALGEEVYEKAQLTIRTHDTTLKDIDGKSENNFKDIEVPKETKEWLISGLIPRTTYISEVGIKGNEGEYIVFASSKPKKTPAESISENLQEEWMTIKQY